MDDAAHYPITRAARKTRDLCQEDWQDVHPTDYAPDTIRYGTCDRCRAVGTLVYRSWIADEEPAI